MSIKAIGQNLQLVYMATDNLFNLEGNLCQRLHYQITTPQMNFFL